MPLTTTPVTGPVSAPDGSVPSGATLVFVPSGYDTDAGDLQAGTPVRVTLDSDGEIPDGFGLWPNTNGSRQTYYAVTLIWQGGAVALGNIEVGDAASYALTDLLDAAPVVVPGYNRIITQAEVDAILADAEAARDVATQGGVTALVGSTVDGLAATAAEGDTFAVADTDLALYRRDAAGAAVLLNDAWVPAFPLPYIPAAPAVLSTVCEINGVRAVPWRAVLGRRHAEATDAASAFNAVFDELAGNGLALVDTEGIKLRSASPLRPVNGLTIVGIPGVSQINKAFAGAGTESALICRADFNTDTDNLTMSGLILGTETPGTHTGMIMAVYGDDLNLQRMEFRDFLGGQGLIFGGERFLLNRIKSRTPYVETGTGPIRCIGGKNGRAYACDTEGGDDGSVQFVPVSGLNTQKRYGYSTEDCWQIGGHTRSAAAKMMVAAIATSGVGSGDFPGVIRNVGWIGIVGSGTNRNVVVECTEGDGTIPRQIDNVRAIQCFCSGTPGSGHLEVGSHIKADHPGAIGKVVLDITQAAGTMNVDWGLSIDAEGCEVELRGGVLRGERSAMRVAASDVQVTVNGPLRCVVEDAGGGGVPDVAAIQCGVAASGMRFIASAPITCEGIATDLAGMHVAGVGARAELALLTAYKRSGATGTSAITSGASAELVLGGVEGDVDNLTDFGGALLRRHAPQLTTSTADTTVGRGVKVGDFGIGFGAAGLAPNLLDLDDVTLPGGSVWRASAAAAGTRPPGFTGENAFFWVQRYATQMHQQIARVDGVGGLWRRVFNGSTFSTWTTSQPCGFVGDTSNLSKTITLAAAGPVIRSTGTLSADRTWRLSASGAVAGYTWRVARTGGGAFNLIVVDDAGGATLATLATNGWADFVFDGTNWLLSGKGVLT